MDEEVKVTVLDFDGTLTDLEAMGGKFETQYKKELARYAYERAGVTRAQFESSWLAFDELVEREPEKHPWIVRGKAVCQPLADPCIRCVIVGGLVFDSFDVASGADERASVLGGTFHDVSKSMDTAFKYGAKEFLAALASSMPVYVITNSKTDTVYGKLQELGASGLVKIIGSARKFDIDDSWDGVPAEQRVYGLSRPILLRRKAYFDALEHVRTEMSAAYSEMLVAGDVYELDLALPQALGAHVCLVESQGTAEYERRAVRAYKRGHVCGRLQDVLSIACGFDGT